MRFGNWEPYPEEKMGLVFPRYTICEVLRQIWHRTEDQEARLKLRIAISMGKSMDRELRSESPCKFCDKRWPDKTREVNQQVKEHIEQLREAGS